jgi:hypothetical protein
MAPPYHYHGPPPQQEQAAPAAEDETGAASVGSQPRSLWIGGLLSWMDEDYLYSCFTRSPEVIPSQCPSSYPLILFRVIDPYVRVPSICVAQLILFN